MRKTHVIILLLLLTWQAAAQQPDSIGRHTLGEVSVSSQRREGMSKLKGPENGITMGRAELFKAACCNLGESFVNNPSVDVNYSDAATGARQIKLLGLSGTYVQMLTEGMPNFRGVAAPYALNYVPGAWMKSISVSKGAASVKNGYESITGQIDIEYLKPQDDAGISVNLYGNTMARFEANADANLHLGKGLSTELLLHADHDFMHSDANGDGFMDLPATTQYNLQNRWHYASDRYIMHAGITALREERMGGELTSHAMTANPFAIHIEAERYEAYTKHAFILDPAHGTNVALMASVAKDMFHGGYGYRHYRADELDFFAQLMVEHQPSEVHGLSAGVSITSDGLSEQVAMGRAAANPELPRPDWRERVAGAYAQYTFKPSYHLTAMAGIRADYSSVFGTFATPRAHLKWVVNDLLTLRASSGLGRRTVHPYAEYNYLFSTGRQVQVDSIGQERAWNSGLAASLYIPLFNKTLKVNAEYYYTHFFTQTVVDYNSDSSLLRIVPLDGRSYSHTVQVDASYQLTRSIELTAAYRLNDVRVTIGGELLRKPLTARSKTLFTLSYHDALDLWQVDATLQINGGGDMPRPYTLADGTPSWEATFPTYAQMNMQLTRRFRHCTLYVGAENITSYRQPTPILGADNPWASDFEPTLTWGPMQGIMVYGGLRLNLGQHMQ
ncbi:MAG: TonB-dependent receptor [Bacteroidales bacterium]|nr:TonB-dependent receptor [Bacteroidales bacterium]